MESAGREPERLVTIRPERVPGTRPARPPREPTAGHAPYEAGPGVTWRAILLCLVLMPINIWWVTIVEVRWYTLDGTCLPLFITPIFFLFVLVLANRLVAYWRPRAALLQ